MERFQYIHCGRLYVADICVQNSIEKPTIHYYDENLHLCTPRHIRLCVQNVLLVKRSWEVHVLAEFNSFSTHKKAVLFKFMPGSYPNY